MNNHSITGINKTLTIHLISLMTFLFPSILFSSDIVAYRYLSICLFCSLGFLCSGTNSVRA